MRVFSDMEDTKKERTMVRRGNNNELAENVLRTIGYLSMWTSILTLPIVSEASKSKISSDIETSALSVATILLVSLAISSSIFASTELTAIERGTADPAIASSTTALPIIQTIAGKALKTAVTFSALALAANTMGEPYSTALMCLTAVAGIVKISTLHQESMMPEGHATTVLTTTALPTVITATGEPPIPATTPTIADLPAVEKKPLSTMLEALTELSRILDSRAILPISRS